MKTQIIKRLAGTILLSSLLLTQGHIVTAQSKKKERAYQKSDREFRSEAIQSALESKNAAILLKKNTITFAVKTDADSVKLMDPFKSSMTRLDEQSNSWAVDYILSAPSKSIINWRYVVYKNGEVSNAFGPEWRGTSAREIYPAVENILGQVIETEMHSERLNESRGVTVYLPPNHSKDESYPVLYVTDGKGIKVFANLIDPLIASNQIKPIIIVGAHAQNYRGTYKPDFSDYDPAKNIRAREYLKGFMNFGNDVKEEDERFTNHKLFFVNELSEWAESNYGASSRKYEKLISGSSNGAGFMTTLMAEDGDNYGGAIILSAGWPSAVDSVTAQIDTNTKLYFSAGKYEPGFLKATKEAALKFEETGFQVKLNERYSGHDGEMWNEELINSLKDYFSHKPFPKKVISTLEALYKKDQELRIKSDEVEEKYGRGSEELQEADRAMREQDEKNTKVLMKIIARYGWPHQSSTSKLANQAAFLVVQHNFDIREKYLPMILASAKRNETPGAWLAILQDRILMSKHKEQIYGSQLVGVDGELTVWTIMDDSEVDARRKEVGLQPLAEYLDNFGIKYEKRPLDDMPRMFFGSLKKPKR